LGDNSLTQRFIVDTELSRFRQVQPIVLTERAIWVTITNVQGWFTAFFG